MVAVDTLSLPGASIIVYNNWPRVPTGTPAFIIRYCQIQDPYKEGGVPLKVEVTECPAAEARGYPCSCGFINFVGWNWLGSNANIWDSSVVNGDDLALTFSLSDKKGAKVIPNLDFMRLRSRCCSQCVADRKVIFPSPLQNSFNRYDFFILEMFLS